MSGLLIAAPASGSGKTTVTLGLARALRDAGVRLVSGKAGPDYIDPAFHAAASGKPCLNYDPWAMRPELIRANAAMQAGEGLGTHDPDGHLLLIDAGAHTSPSRGNQQKGITQEDIPCSRTAR